MICVGVVVVYCFTAQAVPVDSFCQVYQQVVQAKGDAAIAAPLAVKRRILANEQIYAKVCKGR